jgi:hypothetical protein
MKNTLVVAVMALVIGAMIGWFVNGWRLEAAFGRAQNAALEEYERISREQRETWEAQAKKDEAARIALSASLRESRATADDLRNRIAEADLNAPAPSIASLSECPTKQEVQTLLDQHKPFNDNLVRLWNASTRGSSAGSNS